MRSFRSVQLRPGRREQAGRSHSRLTERTGTAHQLRTCEKAHGSEAFDLKMGFLGIPLGGSIKRLSICFTVFIYSVEN